MLQSTRPIPLLDAWQHAKFFYRCTQALLRKNCTPVVETWGLQACKEDLAGSPVNAACACDKLVKNMTQCSNLRYLQRISCCWLESRVASMGGLSAHPSQSHLAFSTAQHTPLIPVRLAILLGDINSNFFKHPFCYAYQAIAGITSNNLPNQTAIQRKEGGLALQQEAECLMSEIF